MSVEYFPTDYFSARDAFRARAGDGEQQSREIDARGPGGEALSIDSAYFGSGAPRRLVLITSGIHGVEGYAGCALQQLWLSEFAGQVPADTGFLLVHALNPFGFAHGRRANEHNVDLNRNSLSAFPGPANPEYVALNAWLNPETPAPRFDDFVWRALPSLWRRGRAPLAQTIAAGQYEFPHGLFYGGTQREPSLVILAEWLAQPRYASVQRVWHLDLHTGLGAYGRYQFLSHAPPQSAEYGEWARAFGAAAVKSDHPSDAAHYSAHGILTELTRRAFPAAHTSTATLEFGTFGPVAMLRILRAENRVHHHGASSARHAARIREAWRDAAAPRDPAWRAAVIGGGRQIFTRFQLALADVGSGK